MVELPEALLFFLLLLILDVSFFLVLLQLLDISADVLVSLNEVIMLVEKMIKQREEVLEEARLLEVLRGFHLRLLFDLMLNVGDVLLHLT